MNKWTDLFEIIQEERVHTRTDGSTFTTRPYYIVYKSTGQKYFPKTRQYGYSHLVQAKIAASKVFSAHIKSIEEDLLG